MDLNKLYSKSELFHAPYSKLKRYVKGHGLPIERGVSRAKLAKQLIAAGIFRKPAEQRNKSEEKQVEKKQKSPRKRRRVNRRNQRKKSEKPLAQSPKYMRRAKESIEIEPPNVKKRKPWNMEVPGDDIPPSLTGLTKRDSSIQSQKSAGGGEFPGTPDRDRHVASQWSVHSISVTPDSSTYSRTYSNSFSRGDSSFSRLDSNVSVGTNKRTPEASRSNFSFSDTESLPGIDTCMKRDPSDSSRDLESSTRMDKQRDSITISKNGSRSTNIPFKSTKKKLQNTKKGRRRRRRRRRKRQDSEEKLVKKQREHSEERYHGGKPVKKKLAELRELGSGERSSKNVFGKDVDQDCLGIPPLAPSDKGEMGTIHADPRTPEQSPRASTRSVSPATTEDEVRELRAQLTMEMNKGDNRDLESVKMYLLPLLAEQGLKRVLSDQESVFLSDVVNADTSGEMTSSISSMVMDLPIVDSFENSADAENSERVTSFEFNSVISSDSSFSSRSDTDYDDASFLKTQQKFLGGRPRRGGAPQPKEDSDEDKWDDDDNFSKQMERNPMRTASGFFDDEMLEEADELQYCADDESDSISDPEAETQPAISDHEKIPRRMRMSLRDLRKKEEEIQQHKQDQINQVKGNWEAKSSVDGFFFDKGDKVLYEDRRGQVLTRRKNNGETEYDIILDDDDTRITALESELVYAMILSIRRRTVSSAASTQASTSSLYYQTCTDRRLLSPSGGSTYHCVDGESLGLNRDTGSREV